MDVVLACHWLANSMLLNPAMKCPNMARAIPLAIMTANMRTKLGISCVSDKTQIRATPMGTSAFSVAMPP